MCVTVDTTTEHCRIDIGLRQRLNNYRGPYNTVTTILRPFVWDCPGEPVGARRNIHPLTPILIINHPSSASSIYCDP